ncbi:MAG: FeoB-associated Cys-rich membrane protein [Oligosphaeraceae bacterium]
MNPFRWLASHAGDLLVLTLVLLSAWGAWRYLRRRRRQGGGCCGGTGCPCCPRHGECPGGQAPPRRE